MIGSVAMIGFKKYYHVKQKQAIFSTQFLYRIVSGDITSTGNN